MSYLYLMYVKVYPLTNHAFLSFVFNMALLNRAFIHLNNFCFQYERLMITVNNGFAEVIAMNVLEDLRNSV